MVLIRKMCFLFVIYCDARVQQDENLYLRNGFSYHCEEHFCQRGYYTPAQCKKHKCAVLLAEYPGQLTKSLH